MYKPTLNQAKDLSSGYTIIPISCEIFADTVTPISVLQNIKTISSQYYLLESVENGEKWGRYTFLGFNPIVELRCKDGLVDIKSVSAATKHIETKNPNIQIREILNQFRSPQLDFLPPFTGGFAGYFAYDYIKYSEKALNLNSLDDTEFYDVDLMLFDKIIAFDHFTQKIIVIVNIKVDNLEANYQQGIIEIENIIKLITSNVEVSSSPSRLLSDFTPTFNENEYCEIVETVKNYIHEGDIFQAVPSNRRCADFEGSLFDAYRVLRTTNPSPYMFYLKFDDVEITGTSPETLIKLKNGNIATFPIAGTRPRGKSEEEDNYLVKQLLSDEKELSEHNMLVDLGRNDLGKISEFASVDVKDYLSIRKYSHVIHIESKVIGKLRKGLDQLDAISAVLPAGTLSGAPKIRACEIINEVEAHKRGIYGGAIGYIDFTGNTDTCIAIRMAVLKDNKVYVQTGAGIVADSVPETEYTETTNKAQAIINALEMSGRGIR